ncbi:MAG: methyltransferase domain-containing protein [Solirubrobacteraceae bacterium]
MLRDRLTRAAGWPGRRLLDQRVLWLVGLVEDRLGRSDVTVHDRLGDLDRLARAQLQGLGFLELESGAPGRRLAELSAPLAGALNWADGPGGYAAQAGLWFNPPVPVEHRAGAVGVLLVNERVVEQPFVFAEVGAAPRRVLDLGGAESTVALSLATLGHDVTVVDPRGYPVAHPNLTEAAVRLEDHEPAAPYDVAVALSAVEHFGLGHYESGPPSQDDHAALARLRELVRPGGRLVLSVPFAARASVDAFQRVYDAAGLAELLAGWRVERRLAAWQTERTEWRLGSCEEPLAERGVALVTATRPPVATS